MLRWLLEENSALIRELDELRELRQLVLRDPADCLSDRPGFDQRLTNVLARVARDPDCPGALLAVEVEGLSAPRGGLGTSGGAGACPGVADVVRGALRVSDTCCRTGVDGFLILLPDTDAKEVRLVMARLRTAVIRAGSRQDGLIGISIGCAMWPADARRASRLVALAVRAMTVEKRRLQRAARLRPRPRARAGTLALVK